jgi:hypothetical protein
MRILTERRLRSAIVVIRDTGWLLKAIAAAATIISTGIVVCSQIDDWTQRRVATPLYSWREGVQRRKGLFGVNGGKPYLGASSVRSVKGLLVNNHRDNVFQI